MVRGAAHGRRLLHTAQGREGNALRRDGPVGFPYDARDGPHRRQHQLPMAYVAGGRGERCGCRQAERHCLTLTLTLTLTVTPTLTLTLTLTLTKVELGRLLLSSSAADGSAAQQAELATLGAERARVLADEERLRGEVVKLRGRAEAP